MALLGAPDLLVLDEPTVGLDPLLRRELWATFHRLADAGTTLLVSTHVMDEAERCDRLLLMREGQILAEGTPAELCARAASPSSRKPLSPDGGAMTLRVTSATARRVLEQLRRDRRTLALILVVPPALLTLLRYILDANQPAFERIAVPLVGMFPLIIMFLITSIAMLRERTGGTLERLMSLPLAKLDLIAGYAIAFALVAASTDVHDLRRRIRTAWCRPFTARRP